MNFLHILLTIVLLCYCVRTKKISSLCCNFYLHTFYCMACNACCIRVSAYQYFYKKHYMHCRKKLLPWYFKQHLIIFPNAFRKKATGNAAFLVWWWPPSCITMVTIYTYNGHHHVWQWPPSIHTMVIIMYDNDHHLYIQWWSLSYMMMTIVL